MRFSGAVLFSFCLLLLCLVGDGCARRVNSLTIVGSKKITKNQTETDAFEKQLAVWLLQNSFTPTNDPGGEQSWASLRSAGENVRWYRGCYQGSPPFMLQVHAVTRKDVRGERTEYDFEHAWDFCGSRPELTQVKALSDRFVNDFTKWLSKATPVKQALDDAMAL